MVVDKALKCYPAGVNAEAITNLLGNDYLALRSDNIAHSLADSLKYNSREALEPKERFSPGVGWQVSEKELIRRLGA